MLPGPRHHAQKRRAQERTNEIRAAATTLARLLVAETRHNEWREGDWQRCQSWRHAPGNQPHWFYAPPRRTFRERPDSRQPMPYFHGRPRWPVCWRREAPNAYPQDWRPRVLPRRGPPVATIPIPLRYRQERWESRQPRGVKPRGTLRGGPERTADDPRRNPRGGLCGGPGRSAKEPQAHQKQVM